MKYYEALKALQRKILNLGGKGDGNHRYKN